MKGICGVGGEGDATKYMLRCGCEADTVFCTVNKDLVKPQVLFTRGYVRMAGGKIKQGTNVLCEG